MFDVGRGGKSESVIKSKTEVNSIIRSKRLGVHVPGNWRVFMGEKT